MNKASSRKSAKKRAASPSGPGLSFSPLGGDPAVRLLVRDWLKQRPCYWCGGRHSDQTATQSSTGFTPAVPSFDPTVYLAVWPGASQGIASPRPVTVTSGEASPSAHTLTLKNPPSLPPRGRRSQKFFSPAGQVELRALAPKRTAETEWPAFYERVRLWGALPAGLLGLGREAMAHSLELVDRAGNGLASAAAAAVPRALLYGERTEDTLPSSSPSVTLRRRLRYASGVPKNLPVERALADLATTGSSGPATFGCRGQAPRQLPSVEESHEALLDRWGAIHDRLLNVLRARSGHWLSALTFSVLAFALVLPIGAVGLAARSDGLRQSVRQSGEEGLAALLRAGDAVRDQDPAAAVAAFRQASASLGAARSTITTAAPFLKNLVLALPGVGEEVRTADRLLRAGEELSRAGAALADSGATGGQNLLFSLATVTAAVERAAPEIASADEALRGVNSAVVPPQFRAGLESLRDGVHLAHAATADFPRRSEILAGLLGRDGRRRYLIVFQNSNELRPTGGFIGSFAEVTVDRGELVALRVPTGGSYDLTGDQRSELLPPEPLRRVTGRWQFHDANWFPDFPTSAAKLAWFYEKGGGPTVDGVIAVNSEILPRLLTLVGPIAMPAYRRTITSDNVIREMQTIVEVEYDRVANKPKKFVGELLSEVLRRLAVLPPDKILKFGETLAAGLGDKTIQLYLRDERAAALSDELGWSGRLRSTADADTLLVVDTNIGGGKTDAVVEKSAAVKAVIAPDGSITDTVTLIYEHHGVPTDRWSGETYRDYLRLYLPSGSQLVAATGDFSPPPPDRLEPRDPKFSRDSLLAAAAAATVGPGGTEVWSENDRTVFGNWLELRPGARATVTFVYRSGTILPHRGATLASSLTGGALAAYRLRWEKQSGAQLSVSVSLTAPDSWESVWRSPDLERDDVGPTPLLGDRLYGAVFRPRF